SKLLRDFPRRLVPQLDELNVRFQMRNPLELILDRSDRKRALWRNFYQREPVARWINLRSSNFASRNDSCKVELLTRRGFYPLGIDQPVSPDPYFIIAFG